MLQEKSFCSCSKRAGSTACWVKHWKPLSGLLLRLPSFCPCSWVLRYKCWHEIVEKSSFFSSSWRSFPMLKIKWKANRNQHWWDGVKFSKRSNRFYWDLLSSLCAWMTLLHISFNGRFNYLSCSSSFRKILKVHVHVHYTFFSSYRISIQQFKIDRSWNVVPSKMERFGFSFIVEYERLERSSKDFSLLVKSKIRIGVV